MAYVDDIGLSEIWGKIADLNDWMPKTAPAHNSIYRGKDITYKLTDGSLFDSISSGTFDDIFVGDYVVADIKKVNPYIDGAAGSYHTGITIESAATPVTFRVMELDRDYGFGDTGHEQLNHHAVMVPDTSVGRGVYGNVSDTGYAQTDMHTIIMPAVATQLEAVFGNHLLTNRSSVSNTIVTADSGAKTIGGAASYTWIDYKVCMLSEFEVYGHTVTAALGGDRYKYLVGSNYCQLTGFRYNRALIRTPLAWWMRDMVWINGNGVPYQAGMSNQGVVGSLITGSSSADLRPKFLIG